MSDFQVLEGSPASFPWKVTDAFTSAKWLDIDGTVMMTHDGSKATKVVSYKDLIDFIPGTDSVGMKILKTVAADTGDYKVEVTFTSPAKTVTETTHLKVKPGK